MNPSKSERVRGDQARSCGRRMMERIIAALTVGDEKRRKSAKNVRERDDEQTITHLCKALVHPHS